MKAERWPLDIAKMKKGDVISPETCEEVLALKRDAKHYSLALLGLCETIRKEGEKTGRALPCRSVKDGIEVMTDEVAAKYYREQFRGGLRQCSRAHRRQISMVSRAALSDESQRQYDRSLAMQGMLIQSTRKIVREFTQKQIKAGYDA